MAIENATNVVLRIADDGSSTNLQTIAFATSASLSMSTDLRDSTTKSSEGFSESLAGLKSFELSGDAFVALTADTVTDIDPYTGSSGTLKTVTKLWDLWVAGTKVDIEFGTGGGGTGDKSYTGEAFITSLSIDSGVEENATYSISLTGTGALAEA